MFDNLDQATNDNSLKQEKWHLKPLRTFPHDLPHALQIECHCLTCFTMHLALYTFTLAMHLAPGDALWDSLWEFLTLKIFASSSQRGTVYLLEQMKVKGQEKKQNEPSGV